VFETRVLRRIFELKRDEMAGGLRGLHNENLHNLYCLSSIIRMIKSRKIRWAGHIACMRERMKAYRILVRNPEEKKPLRRPRRRWVDNIKLDLKEIKWGVIWAGLSWLGIGISGGL
jgi:hypothetical protein